MWRYKQISINIVICLIISVLYACVFNPDIRVETMYLDIYLAILWVLVYTFNFVKKGKLQLEMHRFTNYHNYILFRFKNMSILNLVISSSRYLGAFITSIIYQSPFNITILHYTIHWFIVFEIFILFSLSFLRSKYYQLIVYGLLVILMMMFFFGKYFDPMLSTILIKLNPFIIYFFPNLLLSNVTLLVYGSYILLGYLLLRRKPRRVE